MSDNHQAAVYVCPISARCSPKTTSHHLRFATILPLRPGDFSFYLLKNRVSITCQNNKSASAKYLLVKIFGFATEIEEKKNK